MLEEHEQLALPRGVRLCSLCPGLTITEFHQVYLDWRPAEKLVVRGGLHEITLGNQRFVGNVGWRQNRQSFEGIRVDFTGLADTTLTYAWVSQARQVSGASRPMNSHLGELEHVFVGIGALRAYGYLLDWDEASQAGLSTLSYGASLAGAPKLSERMTLPYRIELAQQNFTDFLTGLYNRRGFFTAVKPLSHLSQRNNQSVGIMLADVDDFKKVNDRLGHETGDRVLKEVAAILKSSVRTSDLVARYGGEEFIVFASTAGRDSVGTLAEKIRKNVESGLRGSARVTVSIGVADSRLPRNVDEGIDRLIRRADRSLYEAKNSGKNRVARSPESAS